MIPLIPSRPLVQIQGGSRRVNPTQRRRHRSRPAGEQKARAIPSPRRPIQQAIRSVFALIFQRLVAPLHASASDLGEDFHFPPFSVFFAHRTHPTPYQCRYQNIAAHPTSRHSMVAPQACLCSTLRQREPRRQPMAHVLLPAHRCTVQTLGNDFASTR